VILASGLVLEEHSQDEAIFLNIATKGNTLVTGVHSEGGNGGASEQASNSGACELWCAKRCFVEKLCDDHVDEGRSMLEELMNNGFGAPL
jgi:hypothetical protein